MIFSNLLSYRHSSLWTRYLASLNPICKMGIIILLAQVWHIVGAQS